ncbi:MAG: hypothetical protein Q7T54_02285 [Candidatus Levybacteria bacterium]|nr:hypothetical protein [Candidatus Levybacteria bacterium]
MKYQYFIASRWRNKFEVLRLTKLLREKGKSVYCFIEGDGSNYELKDLEEKYSPEEFMKYFERIPDWPHNNAIKEIFDVDMNALKDSETVILLLPAGKSAHIEAGVSYGMGKKTILIGEQKEAEPLYMIFDEMYLTAEEFVKSL